MEQEKILVEIMAKNFLKFYEKHLGSTDLKRS